MSKWPNQGDAANRWPRRVLALDDFHIQPEAPSALGELEDSRVVGRSTLILIRSIRVLTGICCICMCGCRKQALPEAAPQQTESADTERRTQAEAETSRPTSSALQLPDDATALYQLATYYRSQGKWAEALSVLRKARKLGPEDMLILSSLSDCAERTGAFDEALDARYHAVMSVIPAMRSADMWLDVARVATKAGNEQFRDFAHSQALAADPFATEAWDRLRDIAASASPAKP